MIKSIKNQKNVSLILEFLKKTKKIRRSDLYKEIMKLQKKKFGKATSYQVISRDVTRLLNENLIKVVDGGQRSQILSLK